MSNEVGEEYGGGVFAGGFFTMHVGNIHIDRGGEDLHGFLSKFGEIVEMFRPWRLVNVTTGEVSRALQALGEKHQTAIMEMVNRGGEWESVYDAYNAASVCATHQMKSASRAFWALDRGNAGFQRLQR